MPACPSSTCATAGSFKDSAPRPIPPTPTSSKPSQIAMALASIDATLAQLQSQTSNTPTSALTQDMIAYHRIASWVDKVSKERNTSTHAKDMDVYLKGFDKTMDGTK